MNKPIYYLYGIILSLIIHPSCLATSVTKYSNQRQQYERLQHKIAAIAWHKPLPLTITNQIDSLKSYPLYPYLKLSQFKRHLPQHSANEILLFLHKYSELPFSDQLRTQALKTKFKARKWRDVIALYQLGDQLKYQCMQLTALYHSKKKQQALAQVVNVWLTGHSLPSQCNFMLKRWRKAKMQTSELTFQRIKLTLINRKSHLARYLSQYLSPSDTRKYLYWKTLYNKPKLLIKSHYWQHNNPDANLMLRIAIERLSVQSIDKAIDIIDNIRDHIGLAPETKQRLINAIALRAIHKDKKTIHYWLNLLSWPSLNTTNTAEILRYLINKNHWQIICQLFEKHYSSPELSPTLDWQYWYASSLAKIGKTVQANKLYQSIAQNRRYYGFLASEKLNINYSLNHQTLITEQQTTLALNRNPRLIRAKELYLLGQDLPARREWYQLVKRLSENQRLGAALIAHQWGWHNRAIITLAMTQSRDDLNVRFPMVWQQYFNHHAKSQDINLSWPLAIARQESAFLSQAISSSGAKGVMQLMPTTARMQARKQGVFYNTSRQLFDPQLNIQLGISYLSEMLNKFDNNLAVAAAAYNAGPHRVKRWLNKEVPQEQWIESIPYRETREYVKNILTYSVIYQYRLSQQIKMPNAQINPKRMGIIKT